MISRRAMMNDEIVSKNGETILANKSKGSYLNGLRVFGASNQMQTTGAQLLHDDWEKSQTSKGVTISLKDCMVSFKGTMDDDGSATRPVLDYEFNLTEFKGKTLSLVSDDPNLFLCFRVKYSDNSEKYMEKEVTVDGNVISVIARFFYRETNPPSGTVINETHKVMLCESKNKELPWEPYTGGKPSPSPEYPQEIGNVGDDGQIIINILGNGKLSQSLIIPISTGLLGIPVSFGGNYTDRTGQQWICDEIDLDRGERVRRIDIFERVTFTIHPNYEVEGSQLFRSDIKINDDELSGVQLPCMCNKMMKEPTVLTENKIGFYAAYGRIFARIKNVSDVDVFNRMMADNVFLVQRPDPIITPLPPEEIAAYKSLHTYAGTTVVTNDENTGMEVSYRKVRG